MKLISHRGNIYGPNAEIENDPLIIASTLTEGYDCEIDVWFRAGEFYLGHEPEENTHYHVSINFLKNDKLWCHAKNIEALYMMSLHSDIHCFFHQNDDVTLTSRGYIWTYPNIPDRKEKKIMTPKSVIVQLENYRVEYDECYGICSDYVGLF